MADVNWSAFMIQLYRYGALLVVVGASLSSAFLYGQHTATVAAERNALEREQIVNREIEALAGRLRDTDEALLIEQKRTATVKREEVIKYVTKYKTKLVEVPVTVECINDSGLLDILNATTPTAAE